MSNQTASVLPPSIAGTLSLSSLLSAYTSWKDYELRSEAAAKADRIRERSFTLQQQQLAEDRRINQQNFELSLRREDARVSHASRLAANDRYRTEADLEIARIGADAASDSLLGSIVGQGVKAYVAYKTGGV